LDLDLRQWGVDSSHVRRKNDSNIFFSETKTNHAATKKTNGDRDQPNNILCSEPYYGINYPLRGSKYSFWEGGIRSVGFVYSTSSALLPQQNQGTTYDGLVSASDWRATILGLARLPIMVDGDDGGMESIDQWASIMGQTSQPARNATVFQFWDQAQRYGAMFQDVNGTGHIYKLMMGWPGVGYGVGAMGPIAGLTSRDYTVAPPELDRNLLMPGLISNGGELDCMPGCLFDLTADPYEQNNLWNARQATPEYNYAYNYLNNLIQATRATALSTGDSGVCQNGYAPQSINTPTDGLAMTVAAQCGAFVPWMPAPGQPKIHCGAPSE